MIDGIQSANAASLTVSGVIASVMYGGIIEEVMLRLFFMSIIALIIWKVFCKKIWPWKHPYGRICGSQYYSGTCVRRRTFTGNHNHFWRTDTADFIPMLLAQWGLWSCARLALPQIRYCLRYDRTRIVPYYKQTYLVCLYIKRRCRITAAPLCLAKFWNPLKF